MRTSEYNALFRGLAMRHKLIQHTEAAPRFCRIVVSIDPLQKIVDMSELMSKVIGRTIKPGPGQQVLVVESFHTQYRESGDNRTRLRSGAFMVLQQVTAGDHDAIEQVLDRTEQTGEELLAAILADPKYQVKNRFDPSSITSDELGPLGNGTWYGTRFDFDFITPASAALHHNPTAFLS
ncbi:hypothetical protein MUN82_06520 [Hymenobacter aerilatus]|uniref:Uncharacterized protein n=1 Tax=Hymenobacter aerilatus TaxID=2932251 RepID=A0A8T9T4A2_9BACT|nr:hypothetical protein [Hymenobacter aerilatus]UOR06749.1 hypothetical protein MUN82_06520 [Hymenobacter aerilatus]